MVHCTLYCTFNSCTPGVVLFCNNHVMCCHVRGRWWHIWGSHDASKADRKSNNIWWLLWKLSRCLPTVWDSTSPATQIYGQLLLLIATKNQHHFVVGVQFSGCGVQSWWGRRECISWSRVPWHQCTSLFHSSQSRWLLHGCTVWRGSCISIRDIRWCAQVRIASNNSGFISWKNFKIIYGIPHWTGVHCVCAVEQVICYFLLFVQRLFEDLFCIMW